MTEISRRKFIELTVVGGAVAATGCRPLSHYNPGQYRAEVAGQYGGYNNRVYPYLNQPDGMMDGVPQYFATACRMCPAGCGLMVRTMGGRAVKIEGNPAHPVNKGATCARAQAALQHLYNPDRLRWPVTHAKRGVTQTVDRPKDMNPPDSRLTITEVPLVQTDWDSALKRVADSLTAASGRVAILADAQEYAHSPTLTRLLSEFSAAVGATIFPYSLLDDAPWRAAAKAVYRRDQIPSYQLDEADVIVSFGGDFLEAWPSPVYYNRLFGEFRQGPRRTQGAHGRFIYVGPRMSMTAAKADLWLPCHPGSEATIAQAMIGSLSHTNPSLADAATASGLTSDQIASLAREFGQAGSRAVAVPGNGLMNSSNATAAFTTVETLNAIANSRCVGFGTAAIPAPPNVNSSSGEGASSFRNMQQLVNAIQSGQIGALLILGQPNPIFTLPKATGFREALLKVPFVAAMTPFEDETTAYADVVLPTRTFLEEWGDHVPPVIPPGTRLATLQQPIIDPQYIGGHGQAQDNTQVFTPWMDTRPLGDLLADFATRLGKPMAGPDMPTVVRKTWADLGQADLKTTGTDNDPKWVNALSQGGVWKESAPTPHSGGAGLGAIFLSAPPRVNNGQGGGASNSFALHLYPQIYNHDGRHANLGWMQENPDPMTMAVWNSWVEINMQVAQRLEIRTGDIVRISSKAGMIDVPAIPYPGLHPDVIAMPIGQGHVVYGRNASGRGTNPLAILDPTADTTTGALAYSATQVTLTKIADARSGYHSDGTTLVLAQDRPGGQEPDAVKDLIHTTAQEWKTAKKVYPSLESQQSIFKRGGKKPTE